jgi:hypothetical protein
MIRIRNDDVLLPSGDWPDPVKRIKRIHRWISEFPEYFIHVPTILVKEIQQYPEAIEFVIEETKEGRMLPEIHGLEHIDYGRLTSPMIVEHLEQCLTWFHDNLNRTPTKFYTPWGGMDLRVITAAKSVGLIAVGVDTNWSLEAVVSRLRLGGHTDDLDGEEIFMHWWNRGIRLKRVIMAVSHGSWKAAINAEDSKEFF